MKPSPKDMQIRSNVASVLDNVNMSAQDREIAQAYLQKTETALDLIWLAGTKIRAVFAHGPAKRAPVAVHQP